MTTTTSTETGEAATYEKEIITFSVTIGNETREIEFKRIHERMAISGNEFACRKGNGTKIHRTNAQICYNNGKWVFNWDSGYALNEAHCLITGFADRVADPLKSKHSGTRF
jgi:hypothetical protein